MRSIVFFFLIYLILCACVQAENDFLPALQEKIDDTSFTEYADILANWLQSFNDEHLGKTGIGRFLHYDAVKTELKETKNHSEGRGKKMSMAMMPLIFQIGASSTWMLLTTILAAKSLAVGLMLLLFKIAVSSAKLAAFFTHLKHSKSQEDHHDWTPQWPPHYDYYSRHGHHMDHQAGQYEH